jgi:hypothetical protein
MVAFRPKDGGLIPRMVAFHPKEGGFSSQGWWLLRPETFTQQGIQAA